MKTISYWGLLHNIDGVTPLYKMHFNGLYRLKTLRKLVSALILIKYLANLKYLIVNHSHKYYLTFGLL